MTDELRRYTVQQGMVYDTWKRKREKRGCGMIYDIVTLLIFGVLLLFLAVLLGWKGTLW